MCFTDYLKSSKLSNMAIFGGYRQTWGFQSTTLNSSQIFTVKNIWFKDQWPTGSGIPLGSVRDNGMFCPQAFSTGIQYYEINHRRIWQSWRFWYFHRWTSVNLQICCWHSAPYYNHPCNANKVGVCKTVNEEYGLSLNMEKKRKCMPVDTVNKK